MKSYKIPFLKVFVLFKHESFIQYSFLKNLFLSFFIVNFYFMVKLFFKADRGILKQHPL